MNILRAFTALAVLLILIPGAHAQVQQMDQVAAIVDEGVILQSELDSRLNGIKARFADQPDQLPPEDVLKEQVLERLIVEKLQLQIAERAGVTVSDQEVSQSFAQLAEGQGMTPNQLMEQLNSQGQSVASVMRDLRRELLLQRVQQGAVNSRFEISDAEIDNFLNSTEGQFWQAPSMNLRHIQIGLSNNASPEEVSTAQSTADEVMRKLNAGEEFSSLAVNYSDGPTALDGGAIGWRRALEFPPGTREVLADVEPGDIAGPVRGAGGFHIFQVMDIRGGSQMEMVQQTKARHILIKPNEIRTSEEARDLAASLRQRIVDGDASFEDLAAEHSGDIANALKGGDLGWVLPGQMVPEFEQTMNATEVDAISRPVETRFGWHIIKVDERRRVDMSSDIMRNQARNALRSQRFPEELDLWMREIRSDAFVSILDK